MPLPPAPAPAADAATEDTSDVTPSSQPASEVEPASEAALGIYVEVEESSPATESPPLPVRMSSREGVHSPVKANERAGVAHNEATLPAEGLAVEADVSAPLSHTHTLLIPKAASNFAPSSATDALCPSLPPAGSL